MNRLSAFLAGAARGIRKPAVHIYGAGESGRFARRLLREVHGMETVAFIDSFRDGLVDDAPVLRVDRFLAEAPPDAVVLIASQFLGEIERTLVERGWFSHIPFSFAPLSYRDYVDFRAWSDPILGPSAFATIPGKAKPAPSDTAPAETAAPPADPDDHLLNVSFHNDCLVDLPLTDRCNLRCVYCPHHDIPASEWRDASRETHDEILRLLEPHSGARIELGGGQGETTVLPDWRERCLPLLERGHRPRITTNLARLLSWEEADTLSRFDTLAFSLDSLDPVALRSVRIGAVPATIIANLALIRSAATARDADGPRFILHAVVTARIAPELDRLVAFAATHGVSTVRFIALCGDPSPNGIRAIDDLSRDEATSALEVIRRSYETAIREDVHLVVHADLLQKLRAAASDRVESTPPPPTDPAPTRTTTRECFEPWEHLVTFSNGDAAACCYSAARFPLGRGYADIDALMNAEPFRTLRRRILTGDLNGPCVACVFKPMVPVEVFRERLTTNRSVRRPATEAE